jgi:ParB family transcriptional regulator, chromosome partitioning protein
MNAPTKTRDIRLIPIDRIEVMNPRDRNQEVFSEISENIKKVGLKKPITVTPRPSEDGAERYLLVCGEGRLNTFRQHGEQRIPALVVSVSDEDAFIMSLAENIARRRIKPMERMAGITLLREKGYSIKEISEKTGLSAQYLQEIFMLLDKGEERLIVAVERKIIPLSAALVIFHASDDDKSVQTALQAAYESGELRGRQLMEARTLIQRRHLLGRSTARGTPRKHAGVSPVSLVRAYQKEVQRQQMLVRKASFAQQKLLFVVGALRELYANENFVNLLRAEGLDTLPKYLAERLAISR